MSELSFDNTQRLAARRHIRAFDAIVLTLLMLGFWQAIGSWTQGVAVSPPLQTLVYLAGLLGTSMFWDHAAATIEAASTASIRTGH